MLAAAPPKVPGVPRAPTIVGVALAGGGRSARGACSGPTVDGKVCPTIKVAELNFPEPQRNNQAPPESRKLPVVPSESSEGRVARSNGGSAGCADINADKSLQQLSESSLRAAVGAETSTCTAKMAAVVVVVVVVAADADADADAGEDAVVVAVVAAAVGVGGGGGYGGGGVAGVVAAADAAAVGVVVVAAVVAVVVVVVVGVVVVVVVVAVVGVVVAVVVDDVCVVVVGVVVVAVVREGNKAPDVLATALFCSKVISSKLRILEPSTKL